MFEGKYETLGVLFNVQNKSPYINKLIKKAVSKDTAFFLIVNNLN